MNVQTPMDRVLERITAAELAEELGISQQAVSKWKRAGNPPVGRCARIAQITGLQLQDLHADFRAVAA